MSNKEQARRVWKLYVPAGAAGAATIVCLAGVKRVDGKKTLAAQAALAVSQRAYESYREEVVQELGERKDQALLAKVAEKRVGENPPSTLVITATEDGKVLCFESFSGRYFKSSHAELIRAVNVVNARLLRDDYATLDDFYYEIGLEYTQTSGQTGWKSPRLVELEFSSILYEGKPCLAFDYNYVKSF